MKYIHAFNGSLIALVLFIFTAIFIPGQGPSRDVEIILTVSTFLFAILAGFYIARLNSRYDKIRELIASEDAYWLSIYKTSIFFGKKFSNKVKELIGKYYIVANDYPLAEHYKPAAKYFHTIYDKLNKLKISKNTKAEGAFESMLNFLARIEENRNTSSVIASEKLMSGQWIVLLFLSGIIIFSIFFLKVNELYSQIITVLLSTILVLVILVVRDLQNLRLGGVEPATESGEEIFDFIGELRYYNEKYIKDGTVKIPRYIKQYRLGLHKPGERSKIRIVKR